MAKNGLTLKRLQDVDVKGKRVLVRVDYNVPLKGDSVSDPTRIRETLPTLELLRQAGAKVVLISHLGRPKGKPEAKYSLKPVAKELGRLLGRPVAFADDCVGQGAESVVAGLKPGEVALLENLRFHAEEEGNDEAFSKGLSRHGELFVQDAFGALHRAHASTAGVPRFLPGAIGLLVQRELEFLEKALENPAKPFVAVLGGAKVSDKLAVTLKLLEKVDALLIGGGMAYTFLKAQQKEIGKSLLEKERLSDASAVLAKAKEKRVQVLLPEDHLSVPRIAEDAPAKVCGENIDSDLIGVDIGPKTIDAFCRKVREAKTVFWNGPMGIFEMPPFAKGSFAVAKAMTEATKAGAVTIVGGGDSLAVISAAKLSGGISHCSTGGGASLELLEGKLLPGLSALSR